MSKKISAAQKMINENNLLREKLSDENKKYYEQLLIYIRTAGLCYDDEEIENILFQILQDLLLAQDNEQPAEDYFGQNPQEVADELIQNLGKSSMRESFKLVSLVFGISSFFSLLGVLTRPAEGINILTFILNGLLSCLFVAIIFFMIHKSIYRKIAINKVTSFVLLWLFCSLTLGAFILVALLTPSILTIYISKPISLAVIVILLTAATYHALIRNREGWIPFLPFIWIFGGVGIISRLPWTENWLQHKDGSIAIIVLLIIGNILFWKLSNTSLKKKS